MSSKSNDQGRAYEFSFLKNLYNELNTETNVTIDKNSSYDCAEKAWDTLDDTQKSIYNKSVLSGINLIKRLEPYLSIENKYTVPLEIKIQSDDKGKIGDVRDVVIARETIGWEIGVSLKHNHKAVKHSRLSSKLDFGERWYGVSCSKEYWNAVSPLFDTLLDFKKQGLNWRDVPNKDLDFYVPILNAFMEEINRAYTEYNETIPKRLVEYLLGQFDFYKVMSLDKKELTILQCFNLRGKLNQSPKNYTPLERLPITELPTEIIDFRFKKESSNTVELYLNAGWALSFRLHNASSKVETSLKFDVQFLGIPASIQEYIIGWE